MIVEAPAEVPVELLSRSGPSGGEAEGRPWGAPTRTSVTHTTSAPSADASAPSPAARLCAAALAVLALLGLAVVRAPDAAASAYRSRVARVVFGGLGAWIDHYDYDGRSIATMRSRIDTLAAAGVQTLYLQSSTPSSGVLSSSPARLGAMVARAQQRHLRVVLWYLPTTTSISRDLAHLRAAAVLPGVNAVAVDAESATVRPVAERNRRIVSLVAQLHRATSKPVGVIVPSPTALELWAKATWWPSYPLAALGAAGDGVLTMTYWQYHRGRTTAAAQTAGDLERVHRAVGEAVPVHVVGSPTTAADIAGFCGALRAGGAAGGSVYDAATTSRAVASAQRCARR